MVSLPVTTALSWVWHEIHGIDSMGQHSAQALDPVEFYFIAQSCCEVTSQTSRYKVNSENFHVVTSIVATAVEVFTHISFGCWLINISPVPSESLHYSILCLAYILHATNFALDAVYEIARFACYALLALISSACKFASDNATCV